MLESGERFGKYEIIDLLGRGGMGVVYLAEDTALRRRVALKLLDRVFTSTENLERSFLDEAQTVAGLEHPNIVPIHSLERIEGELTIDMAFMEGGSLSRLLTGAPLGPWKAVSLAHDVLQALACCHYAGIIHRDVKPANVLLDKSGRALLSDFGLARLLHVHLVDSIRTSSSTGFFVGTPRYAPVEAWDGCEPTPAWDVYSVGMLLFETTTGRTPFPADTPFALLKQIQEQAIPPLREVHPEASPELDALVRDMVQREPHARPQDATESLRRLSQTPEFEVVRSEGIRTVHQIRPRPRRLVLERLMRRYVPDLSRKLVAPLLVGALVPLLAVVGLFTFARPFQEVGNAVDSGPVAADVFPRVYDATDVGTGETWPGFMWMGTPAESGAIPIIITESTRLWSGNATPDDAGGFAFKGGWAEYTDKSARVFRYGTLTGRATPLSNSPDLTLQVKFVSSQDASTSSKVVSLRLSVDKIPQPGFLANMNASDYFLPILYNELMPRDLAWAKDLEGMMQTLGTPMLTASSCATEEIALDGQLTETSWQRAATVQTGEPAGSEQKAAPSVRAVYDAQSIYLGVQLPTLPQTPRIVLTVMPQFGTPMSRSPRWTAELIDESVLDQEHEDRGAEVAWVCPWRMATESIESGWSAEIAIPFSDFDEDLPANGPGPGDHWRIGLAVLDGLAPDADVVAYWGWGETYKSDWGLILEFRPP
ncbi:MAG: protein kinase [Candidatus Hydrogenedentes bacterium]|nr:protein kinase [Candidatus Hydrogenedentota bacterium]